MDRFKNSLTRILKQYITEEEYEKLTSGDENLINEVSPIAKAKYQMYLKLRESVELCENEEFNQLVEEKAANYRKKMLTELEAKKANGTFIPD